MAIFCVMTLCIQGSFAKTNDTSGSILKKFFAESTNDSNCLWLDLLEN